MRLEQLARRLEIAGLGTRGQDLFIHYMPAQVTVGMVLLPSLAGDPIDWELGGGWRNSSHAFQLIARDANIPNGYKRASDAVNALLIQQDTILPAMDPDIPASNVRFIRPNHDIITYPRGPSGYFEFSMNFQAAFSIDPD
jgi:hypothetical protein